MWLKSALGCNKSQVLPTEQNFLGFEVPTNDLAAPLCSSQKELMDLIIWTLWNCQSLRAGSTSTAHTLTPAHQFNSSLTVHMEPFQLTPDYSHSSFSLPELINSSIHTQTCSQLIQTAPGQSPSWKCAQEITMPCILCPFTCSECITLRHFFHKSSLRNQAAVCANVSVESKTSWNRRNGQGQEPPAQLKVVVEMWLCSITPKCCCRSRLGSRQAGQLGLPQRAEPKNAKAFTRIETLHRATFCLLNK